MFEKPLFLLMVTLTFQYSSGQELQAIRLPERLPFPFRDFSAIYDGFSNSIYLLGGNNFGVPRGILRFDIGLEKAFHLGRFPIGESIGTAQFDNDGNIFYFGGAYQNETGSSLVYKYFVEENQTYSVAELPYGVSHSGTVRRGNQVVIVGGVGSINGILNFNMATHTHTRNGSLYTGSVKFTTTSIGNKAYIFGVRANAPVIELDLDTLQSIGVGFSDFPRMIEYGKAINDGRNIYILGGYRTNTSSILQFNPDTYSHKFIHVAGMLETVDYFVDAPGAVYVEKLNRIYYFGGYSCPISGGGSCVARDSIFYIDLGPITPTEVPTTTETATETTELSSTEGITTTTLNPDIFNCEERPDGTYPHPRNCSLFIGCRDGVSTVYSCPPPLLFDPDLLTCNVPQLVKCGLTCAGKPDGPHPHPQDCSLFIICIGEELVDVYECPPPFLFDPVQEKCDYPELVICQ